MRSDEIAGRRERVAQEVLARHSVREIAALLSIPRSTVHRDIVEVRKEWQRSRIAATQEGIAEDLERLGAAERAIWAKVMEGDYQAIDRLIKIMERRAKLLGLDAPTRVDLVAMMRKLAEEEGLDPEEAIAEAERLTSRFQDAGR